MASEPVLSSDVGKRTSRVDDPIIVISDLLGCSIVVEEARADWKGQISYFTASL